MPYRLGCVPAVHDNPSILADYAEFCCIASEEGRCSLMSIVSSLGILGSEDEESGDSESTTRMSDAIINEIDSRSRNSNGNYPFYIEKGTCCVVQKLDVDARLISIYKFLLCATRANMCRDKIIDNIDGTALFEKISCEVARNFWGEHSQAYVFGTGGGNSPFKDRATKLIEFIGEYGEFKPSVGSTGQTKDAGIDIVIKIPFLDKRRGNFLAMGQCKTGTSWTSSICSMRPNAILMTFTTVQPFKTIEGMFFVAESVTQNWESLVRSSECIFFDRTRIMQYIPQNIPDDLYKQIDHWVTKTIERTRPQ